ncbi:hypothetical protein BOTBODRAFT_59124 [Botryobasidium botryosum FD-172 SS1]|uniref:Cytochrome P450 n=1 Tax=Botryobasidium botryosum (strain FD-172 SS1) TaxID=930990 RepID=A0A067MAY2_BOTB1|nr:hypothetical protein BOTBODRAFT_59124 [Botryobasidium botryosum FD-172 SS1]
MFDSFSSQPLATSVILGCILVVMLGYRQLKSRKSNPERLPLPPGPKSEFISFPTDNAWVTFTEWQKTIGDIIYLQAFGSGILILNSYEAARDLMDKRAIYSDRPPMPFLGELAGMNRSLLLAGYNDTWRRQRRLAHPGFQKVATEAYWPEQQNAAREYMCSLLSSPKDFYQDAKLMAGKVIISIIYGIQVDSIENEYIVNAERSRTLVKYLSPTTAYVNFFPILKYVPSWFPGAGFQREAEKVRELTYSMMDVPFQRVKSDIMFFWDAGVARHSITSKILENPNANEEDTKWMAGTMYSAGADAIASTFASFILAMTLYPDVQRKAQQEITNVVGTGRLPTFQDRESLPYLECIIKETLRWYPVAPMGTPHRVTEDDYYNGYWIPAGSTVFGNAWAMSRDETMYKDGDRFSPERFEGDGAEDVLDPRAFAYGFGRRSCVGNHFADASLFINMAYMLATFNISKARDEAGNEIEPKVKYVSGLISRLEDFECSIQPRSVQAAEFIREDH